MTLEPHSFRPAPNGDPAPIIIAIVDTGIDPNAPDLAPLLVPGATFVAGTSTAADDHGHGTEVATVVTAALRDAEDTVGDRCEARIMPVKVADASGHTDDPQVARGIRWAVDHGARIVNLSLGTADIPEMRSAVRYAHDRDVVVVAAAGVGNPIFPADYHTVIAATGSAAHARMRRSGLRSRNLVLAPSTAILVQGRDGILYDLAGFTSIAAARVSGLALLLRCIRPDLTADQIRIAIEDGSDRVQARFRWSPTAARGPINRDRSIRIARSMPGSQSATGFLSPAGE